ncbi:MAG: hypothetical protein A2Y41_07850 [Spirochaetes bacterium GWB1_36_13]|nr:MAG: hypothetical protein A2Y41_07850 [Spirochaetes bacterium GWB1_36_13]
MGITVKIDEASFGNIIKKLEAVADYDKKKFLDNMGEDAFILSHKAFKNKMDPNTGEKWEESKASIMRGKVNTTLVDSHHLMESIDYNSNEASGTVEVGTNIVYGKQHQEGIAGKGKNRYDVVRRRFLGVPPAFAQQQAEEIIRTLRL